METTEALGPMRPLAPEFRTPEPLPPPPPLPAASPPAASTSNAQKWDARALLPFRAADDQQSTWGAGRLFSRAFEPNDDLPLSSCFPALSWEERILGFLSCYAIGTVLSLSAFTSMHALMNGNPAPFAIRYTAGNLLSIVSTSFLVGPRTQIRKMTASVRIGATGLYFGTIVTTLVCAFFREPTLTLASMVFQFIALAWYCLSYIPFGRGMLKRLVRWLC